MYFFITSGPDFCHFDSGTSRGGHNTQDPEDRPYECPDCSKKFKARRHLDVHYRIHSGLRPYECPECGQTFNQPGPLNTHRRLHTGERPYSCDICKESFMRKDAMLVHKRKHFMPVSLNKCATYSFI